MKIRLHKDAFFRNYNGIGYLFQQKDSRNLILDKNGIVFFQFINRKAQDINIICKKICAMYTNANISVIKDDFITFMSKMESLNFVIMDKSAEQMKKNLINENSLQNIPDNQEKTKNLTVNEKDNIDTFLQKYFDKSPRLVFLEIEITPNCNLKCVHCYLGCGSSHQSQHKRMSIRTIYKVLREFRAMGGLQVSFTGGEAMLNKDLPKLLKYARKLDLSITILTNAVLLDDSLLKVIKETNVAKIQVSLYSMQAKVHNSITQVKESFQKSKQSIEKLLDNNITVQIGCPVMRENLNSFTEILKWGDKHKVKVRLDGTIIARQNFSDDNLNHRLNLIEQEKFINDTIKYNINYQKRLLNNVGKSIEILPEDVICGAGRYMLCLQANGNYCPCPGFGLVVGNCKQSLEEVWNNSKELNKLRDLTNSSYKECMECSARNYCNLCPSKFYNESGGDMFKISDYFCQVAHLTKKIAEDFVKRHKK